MTMASVEMQELIDMYVETLFELTGTTFTGAQILAFMRNPGHYVPTEEEKLFALKRFRERNPNYTEEQTHSYLIGMFTDRGREAMESRVLGRRRVAERKARRKEY